MSALRFASMLVLAVWIGGIVTLGGIGAPVLFDALGMRPDGGRSLAGELFGQMFLRFQHLAWLLGGLLVGLLVIRRVLGPRPRPFAVRLAAATAMLVMSLGAGLVLAPRIDAIRSEAAFAVDAVDDADPRRAELGRLHALSNALMGTTLVLGIGLLWLEMKDPH